MISIFHLKIFKGEFQCNLKGNPKQNYSEFIYKIIDSDQPQKIFLMMIKINLKSLRFFEKQDFQ
ncbi:unnamed protein product [Paramecium pentaurelia]|uniref:Uncharacterized protein n=1 Tax=Paramecium pentaurelia TaxID=43138 RepID=A0A8S1XUR2_9CILI|nr:unnamed protein product [Paramecium pentaurelia]